MPNTQQLAQPTPSTLLGYISRTDSTLVCSIIFPPLVHTFRFRQPYHLGRAVDDSCPLGGPGDAVRRAVLDPQGHCTRCDAPWREEGGGRCCLSNLEWARVLSLPPAHPYPPPPFLSPHTQGALSSAPLDAINEILVPGDPNYEEYEAWGQQILATAVLAIFVTAPIGLLIINLAGPRLLKKVWRG